MTPDRETRQDLAHRTALVHGHLAECSNILHHLAEACATGARHAGEHGATQENLRDARELRERIEQLRDFIDGGQAYLTWLAQLQGEDR